MTIDGKRIAEAVYERTRESIGQRGRAPVLGIVTITPNFETQKYLTLKCKKAGALGIRTTIVEFPEMSTTEDVVAGIEQLVARTDGVVVQLPLPAAIDTDAVLRALPVSHDVDALNPDTTGVLSPVVGACREILIDAGVSAHDRSAVVIGQGRLVGKPMVRWLQHEGATTIAVTKDTSDSAEQIRTADIIVSGAGDPHFLKPDMIAEGVVLLDAGTSEDGGVLRGDADPACAEKASVYTPVPGGIGPITIAILLENVVILADMQTQVS